MHDFLAAAEALRAELIAMRRDLHAHPELAFEEFRTAGIVAKTLGELGYEVQTGVGKTGVVGVLDGGQPGPQTLLLRFDMDALPINEQVETDFKSGVAGKMHACGHDAHTSIGLGVAKLLARNRDAWRGTVKFVFQPAEEIGQGAAAMIADGVLANPAPTRSLGMHVWSTLPHGTVVINDGPVLAAIDEFDVTITGRGSHGAHPHVSVDPIVVAAHCITALQSIVARNVDPLDQGVVTVGMIRAGSAPNIIPDTVSLSGTVRAFEDATMTLLKRRISDILDQTAAAHGARVSCVFMDGGGLPSVINDPAMAALARNAATRVNAGWHVRNDVRLMVSEDCALFLRAVPGAFVLVGAGNRAAGIDAPHHSPLFQIDEDALPASVAVMTAAAVDMLAHP
jgi:amidohydrolase